MACPSVSVLILSHNGFKNIAIGIKAITNVVINFAINLAEILE